MGGLPGVGGKVTVALRGGVKVPLGLLGTSPSREFGEENDEGEDRDCGVKQLADEHHEGEHPMESSDVDAVEDALSLAVSFQLAPHDGDRR